MTNPRSSSPMLSCVPQIFIRAILLEHEEKNGLTKQLSRLSCETNKPFIVVSYRTQASSVPSIFATLRITVSRVASYLPISYAPQLLRFVLARNLDHSRNCGSIIIQDVTDHISNLGDEKSKTDTLWLMMMIPISLRFDSLLNSASTSFSFVSTQISEKV